MQRRSSWERQQGEPERSAIVGQEGCHQLHTCHRNAQINEDKCLSPPSVTAIGDYSESYYRGQLDRSSTAVGVWYLDWKTAIIKCSQGRSQGAESWGWGGESRSLFLKIQEFRNLLVQYSTLPIWKKFRPLFLLSSCLLFFLPDFSPSFLPPSSL